MIVKSGKTQVVKPLPANETLERLTMYLAQSGYAGAAAYAAWTAVTSEDVSNCYYSAYANWYYDWGSGGVNDRDWTQLDLVRLWDYRYIWTNASYGLTNFAPSALYSGGGFMGKIAGTMSGGTGTLEVGLRINNTSNFYAPASTYHIDSTGTPADPTLYTTVTSFPALGESSVVVIDEVVQNNLAAISAMSGELLISGLAWKWTISKSLNTYSAGWLPTRGKQAFYIW